MSKMTKVLAGTFDVIECLMKSHAGFVFFNARVCPFAFKEMSTRCSCMWALRAFSIFFFFFVR